jgi:hypothetical protein
VRPSCFHSKYVILTYLPILYSSKIKFISSRDLQKVVSGLTMPEAAAQPAVGASGKPSAAAKDSSAKIQAPSRLRFLDDEYPELGKE